MNEHSLYITTEDQSRLRLLLEALPNGAQNQALQNLRGELERAAIVDPAAVPPTVVTMNSRVEIEDLSTGEVEDYTLTFPDRADVEKKMLSVLAPVGTALLGYGEGDEVSWRTPGGMRRLKIRRVAQPAAMRSPTGYTRPMAFSPAK